MTMTPGRRSNGQKCVVTLPPPDLFVTRNLVQALKRLERLLKELELQGMEDTQTIERQVEQIANVNNRNKQLKTQFADAVSKLKSSPLLFH